MANKARQGQGQGSKTDGGQEPGQRPREAKEGFRWRLEGMEDPREPKWERVAELEVSVP